MKITIVMTVYCNEGLTQLYAKLSEYAWQDITGNRKYWDDVQQSDEGLFDSELIELYEIIMNAKDYLRGNSI